MNTLTTNNIPQIPVKKQPLICQHCGHISTHDDDVISEWVYIGGSGYVRRNYCYNQEACWARFDKQTRQILAEVQA